MTKVNHSKSTAHKAHIETKHSQWLPSDELTLTRMLAIKKHNRYKKNQALNGFVLIRETDSDEFNAFLTLLKQNIAQIPINTRMSLLIRTLYYDPSLDTKPDLLSETKKSPKHWTAVDLLVDEQQNLHSFVLDAANSIGYQGIYQELKTLFPQGKHYIFEEDTQITASGLTKIRIIQTQYRGCHIFALQHANILSKIDTHTLYHIELPQLAANNPSRSGLIQPGDFSGSLALAKIFVPTQSLSTIESLNIKDTMVTQKEATISLLEAVKASSALINTDFGPIHVNQKNFHKNVRYIEKESFFYQFSRAKKTRLIEHRHGYLFLQNRSLFNLNAALKRVRGLDDVRDFIKTILVLFMDEAPCFSKKIQQHVGELKGILNVSSLSTPEETKQNLMLTMETILFQISKNKNPHPLRVKCNRLIELAIFLYFKPCQAGIMHANKAYLFSQHACLENLQNAFKSVQNINDLYPIIQCMRDKIHPFIVNKIGICAHDLELVCTDIIEVQLLACTEFVVDSAYTIENEPTTFNHHTQLSLERIRDRFMYLIEVLFFYSVMKSDTLLKSSLTAIIDTTLSLYFETYDETEHLMQNTTLY